MKLPQWLLTGAVATQFILPSLAADDTAATVEALRQQIQELDQKLRVLERKGEIDKEAATEKAKTAPAVSAGPGGFSIRSADTNFVLKVRGYLQADSRWFVGDNAGGKVNDTFLIRRARPIFEGAVYDKYDFKFMLDLASGITSVAGNNGFLQDGYLNARFLPEFQVQLGKFKEPVGLERLQSGANLLFVERGWPTLLVPNRDVGIQLHGDLLGGKLRYELGAFNGVANGGSGDIETSDDEKDLAARLFATPFKTSSVDALRGLGFGVAGTYGNQENALRTFAVPGQQTVFSYAPAAGTVSADGTHWRLVPQAYYYWGPFGIFGEYAISNQRLRLDSGGVATFRTIENRAWTVAASYVLTGEENSWKGFTPKRPFSLSGGGWGAWEIAARVGQLDVDNRVFPLFANPTTATSGSTSWAVGVNWHLNKNLKFNLDYEQTDFDGGTTPLLQKGEKVIFTRAQISF